MTVPKNWTTVKLTQIDSYVGAIKMDNNEKLYFDYGYYSNNLKNLEFGNKVTYQNIANRRVKIITGEKPTGNSTGIYFDKIKFVKEDSMNVKLQFSAKDITLNNEKKIIEAIKTIQFTEDNKHIR